MTLGRRIVVLVTAAVVVGMLTGCGNDGGSPEPATSAPSGELSDIQTTLDSIESDMGGDDAP
jgi:hypothetical protein